MRLPRVLAFITCVAAWAPLLAEAQLPHCISGNCSNGSGESRSFDGTTYRGPYRNGKPEGKGEMRWRDGTIYQGNFRDGLFEGYGTYISKEFSYSGEFKDNEINGKGVLIRANGTREEGIFRDGKLTNEAQAQQDVAKSHSWSKDEAFDRAQHALRQQDYKTALLAFSRAAALGVPEAAYQLGVLYEDRRYMYVVRPDKQIAKAWYRHAAETGHKGAMDRLALLYAGEKDYRNAYIWFLRIAADKYTGGKGAYAQDNLLHDFSDSSVRETEVMLSYDELQSAKKEALEWQPGLNARVPVPVLLEAVEHDALAGPPKYKKVDPAACDCDPHLQLCAAPSRKCGVPGGD